VAKQQASARGSRPTPHPQFKTTVKMFKKTRQKPKNMHETTNMHLYQPSLCTPKAAKQTAQNNG
jgi:hypothetical protein